MFFWSKGVKSEHRKYKDKANKEIYDLNKKREKDWKEERLTYLELISENLRLPPDLIAGGPVIIINGRNSVVIENHKRILEYTDKRIKIATRISCLCIEGRNLRVAYYTKEEIKVTGVLHSVYYTQGA